MPRYRKPQTNAIDPYKAQALPTNRPIAVYYRQSSEGQIGNISTTLQTVDMVEHLMRQGWQRERIKLIDFDAGVSGTKKIHERKGLSQAFELIKAKEIGVIAAQDVDRFFRDMAQIETNIFIEACRENNVLVLTPTFIYDFAHPTQGRYHIQMFREQVQRAADYLEFFVKGRLWRAREYLNDQGEWTGTAVALGYMVDTREFLEAKVSNPQYRRYVPFKPYDDVVRAYFALYKQHNGNLKATWRHIEQHGPFIPEFEAHQPPGGFVFPTNISKRSRFTDKLMLSEYGLGNLLTNAVYIGHWAHGGVIVQQHNHEPIVPLDLFMYAFNRLSRHTLNGEPNPDYMPHRPWVRHTKAERGVEPPTYTRCVYSTDVPGMALRRLSTNWQPKNQQYVYALYGTDRKRIWYMMARFIDTAIDDLLLERLEATTIDEEAWRKAVELSQDGVQVDVRRIQTAIRSAEQAQRSIVENLKALTHPDLVKQLQDDYIASEREIERLKAELKHLQYDKGYQRLLLEARPVLEMVVARWSEVAPEDRRELFEAFAQHAIVNRPNRITRCVTVIWRDGSRTIRTGTRDGNYTYPWTEAERARLYELVTNRASQIELLRAFPGANWRMIRERYTYHFGNPAWRSIYRRSQTKYGPYIRWQDTAEFRAEHSNEAHLHVSANSSYP
jgi:DNA invertase Pin-like site-specific DNA recombinase